MKKILRLIFFALIALVFIGTFVFLYNNSRPKQTTYEEITPIVRDLRRTTIVTGKIEPRDEVAIKPQISGIISQLHKQAGDRVEAGEIIATVKVIPDMSSLSSAESRVRLAQINLEQAQRDFERQQQLYDKGLISANDYEKTRQAYLQSKQERAAAQDALEVVRDGVSSSNASASSTLVRSTISGIILDIPVKVGNSVINSNTFNDGTTIATVADMSDLIFRGNIDETEVGRLTVPMPMDITIGALQDLHFTAALEYISPKATEANGANQFEIKASVTLPDTLTVNTIRSGYSAAAQITLAEVTKALTLPEGAIEFSGDSTFVYVVKGSGDATSYERKQVTTGLSDGLNIEIRSGITKNDRIRGAANTIDL